MVTALKSFHLASLASSLGLTSPRFRSTYKKKDLFNRTDEPAPLSKESIAGRDFSEALRHLDDLKKIRDRYLEIVAAEVAERNKFN